MKVDERGWKWKKVCERGWKWMKVDESGWKRMQTISCVWVVDPLFVANLPTLLAHLVLCTSLPTEITVHPIHIGTEPHFVPVGDTRIVEGGQKLQSWRSTPFVDQHICWCGWCSVTVRFVVSVLPNDPFCWFGEVLRNNNLYQRPILLVSITSISSESTFCVVWTECWLVFDILLAMQN